MGGCLPLEPRPETEPEPSSLLDEVIATLFALMLIAFIVCAFVGVFLIAEIRFSQPCRCNSELNLPVAADTNDAAKE